MFLSAGREAECGEAALPGTVRSLPDVVISSVRVQHEYSHDDDFLYGRLLCIENSKFAW